jgi:hypothetical protein
MAGALNTPCKRDQAQALPTPPTTPQYSSFLFIGRPCCPPFVFTTERRLSKSNVGWLKTADIDELDYLTEKAEEAMRSRPGDEGNAAAVFIPENGVVDLIISEDEDSMPRKKRKDDRKGQKGRESPFLGRGKRDTTGWTEADETALLARTGR